MRVLNLYSGLGGNRTHWQDCDVTSVEINPEVAEFYKNRFPGDRMIVADAHKYLSKHFDEFDFIWSSSLYQEIIFLETHFDGGYVVENVRPYYKPLLPAFSGGRHLFWANFQIPKLPEFKIDNIFRGDTAAGAKKLAAELGIEYSKNIYLDSRDPYQVLRNCVHPELGRLVFDAWRKSQTDIFDHEYSA